MSRGRFGVVAEMRRRTKVITGIAAILAAAAAGLWFYEDNKIYSKCYVEAGTDVAVQDFLKNPAQGAAFCEGSDVIDVSVPGEYHVKIKTGWYTKKSVLYVSDTTAPQGQAVTVSLESGETCGAADFVTGIADATQVDIAFGSEPDFTQAGSQDVEVVLTDLGGNQTVISSQLFISQVVSELTVEAGQPAPTLQDFVIGGESARFISNVSGFDYTKLGDRRVLLEVDGRNYETLMHIVDTVAPKVEVQDVQGYTLVPREAADFVASVEDVTNVEVTFGEEPDLSRAGTQQIEICASDAAGNQTVKTANLILEQDTEAPSIAGVADLRVIKGNSVAYRKNIVVTDNCEEGLELTVDNSAVDLNQVGSYPITYIARDLAGNETTASATVTVLEKTYDENELYAVADGILANIINEGMTQPEKLEAIYAYIQSHIMYIDHSDKDNYVKAAYEGLIGGKGDCYVYASSAKVLLTRAGITNMDIEKIPSRSRHYWNLVNIDGNWYHFDTTPRTSGRPHICMWTETQLMEYSTAHYNSHNYDHSLYPEVVQ